jgi:cytochrome c
MHMVPRRIVLALGILVAGLASVGCKTDPPVTGHDLPELTTASAQIDHGAKVYSNSCARCHGAAGSGRWGPPLVGKEALPVRRPRAKMRTGEFHTAQDIAAFVMHNMPPSDSGRAKLTERDYWAVLAFILDANGKELSEPVGPANAASIMIR